MKEKNKRCRKTSSAGIRSGPELTAMVKHDDYAMSSYDHGDSYSPWYNHGKIVVWCHRTHTISHDHGMVLVLNSMIMPR